MGDRTVGLLAVAFLVLSLGCAFAGAVAGKRTVARREGRIRTLSGFLVGAHLALVSFMLAITFGASMSRLDMRRGLVVTEANAIGTAELRARMLPPPRAASIRRLLIEYAETRVFLASSRSKEVVDGLARSEAVQARLWQETLAAVEEGKPNAPLLALFVSSMNELIDTGAQRKYVVLHDRIPPPIWWALVFISVSAFGTLGFDHGIRGHSRPGIVSLALALALLFAVIEDLDRPNVGLSKVDQSAMVNTLEAMRRFDRDVGSPAP
mgnify:CR=1 FL=1